jgi:anti-sigma factor RsiW
MKCTQLTDDELVAWVDGECSADDAARVAAHVAACSVCTREARLHRRSGEMIARLPAIAPSAGFEARVVTAARGSTTAPGGRVVFLRPRVAAAAAAVLLCAGAGVWWIASSSEPGAPDEITAREAAAVADDLAVLSNLDALQQADEQELAQLADDLDVLDAIGTDGEGG